MPTVDLVIARYNEDLGWLDKYRDVSFNQIFVYNKGKGEVVCPLKQTLYVSLPNVGRCDHTYIYHIIKNYNTLADVTIFAKGSVICKSRIVQREPEKFSTTVTNVFKTYDSVLTGKHYPPNLQTSMGNVVFKEYTARCNENIDESTNHTLHPAAQGTFGEWYKVNFPTIIDEDRASFSGIFAISKKHIHVHPVNYYTKFLNELAVDSNPLVGHFIERAWFAIFYKIPDECFYEISFQGGGRRVRHKKKFTRRLKKHHSKK